MRKLTKEQQDAVETVQEAISAYRTQLEAITLVKEGFEPDPILIEAETKAGYYCQMMVNPKDVAKILLKYDYPIYEVLGDEAPQEMWDDLAEQFGVGAVTSFDL